MPWALRRMGLPRRNGSFEQMNTNSEIFGQRGSYSGAAVRAVVEQEHHLMFRRAPLRG